MDGSMEVQSQNLALITLKERCHLLKHQLKAVEEENTMLKVQLLNVSPPSTSSGLITDLEVLKKEKQQLRNQILILATENNNMWSRLSRLTVVNRNLTKRFTKISDTLEKYGISSVMSDTETDNSVTMDSKDYRKNLEALSLRLIDGIKLEKTELERQYAEMVNLHKNEVGISGEDLAFSSLEPDEDSVMGSVRKHSQKLNQLKQTILMQQAMLVAALESLKKYKCAENRPLKQDACTETPVQSVPLLPVVETDQNIVNCEQICPLCGIHCPDTPEKFCDHVTAHFERDGTISDDFVQLS